MNRNNLVSLLVTLALILGLFTGCAGKYAIVDTDSMSNMIHQAVAEAEQRDNPVQQAEPEDTPEEDQTPEEKPADEPVSGAKPEEAPEDSEAPQAAQADEPAESPEVISGAGPGDAVSWLDYSLVLDGMYNLLAEEVQERAPFAGFTRLVFTPFWPDNLYAQVELQELEHRGIALTDLQSPEALLQFQLVDEAGNRVFPCYALWMDEDPDSPFPYVYSQTQQALLLIFELPEGDEAEDCTLLVDPQAGLERARTLEQDPWPPTEWMRFEDSDIFLTEQGERRLELLFNIDPAQLCYSVEGDCVALTDLGLHGVGITAIAEGQALVTATDALGNRADCQVTVLYHHDLLTEQALGNVEISVSCGYIEYGSIEVTNVSDHPVALSLTPGTYMAASGGGYQNMLVMEALSITLQPGVCASYTLDTCCMNLHLDMPSDGDLFSLGMAQDTRLQALADYCQNHSVRYAVRQAATWILTDNANLADCGTLIYSDGSSAISPEDYEQAQELLAQLQAG